jgi:hypothetical protein
MTIQFNTDRPETDKPATARDLNEAIIKLQKFVVDREVTATRWMLLLQAAYFSVTMAGVWGLLNHH